MNVYFRYILLSLALVLTGCKKDQEPPTVSLTANDGFFNANGTLTLTADTTDNTKVKRVVFQQGDEVIGVDKKAPFKLDVNVTEALNGYHLYTATAYDKAGNNLTSEPVRVFVSIGDKFFGTAPDVPSDYDNMPDFFDQITPGNAGKWGTVEGTRDEMNWTTLDTAYNFARANGMRFKHHTLVWGQQQPGWLADLSPEEQLEEIEEWYAAVAERYPDLEMIDVVNEPLHAPPAYAAALGGAGETGWDWVIKSFEMAREHFPNTQLILNDYQILHLPEFTADYLEIITLLQERGLIDAIGEQGHFLEQTSGEMVLTNLNSLAATGLPIYITEFDLHIANDALQANKMRELFSVFWDHPSVVGVTHWGHREGAVWRTNAYLIRSDGTYRPALDWLLCYMDGGGDSCTVPEYVPPGWQGTEFGVTLEAEQYDGGEGVVALGNVVAYTNAGDWISFADVEFQTGWNKLWVTYTKGNDSDLADISIHLGSLGNAPVMTVPLPYTGGWNNFETLELSWASIGTTEDVYISFNGDAEAVANLDSIRFGKPIPESEINLMPNGGFEAGITGWSSWNGSTLSASTAQVFAGSQSLRATSRPDANQFAVSPNFGGSLSAGTTYAISAQVYQTGAAADTVRMVGKIGCSSGDTYTWLDNNTAVAPNTWTQLDGDLAIPASCTITEVLIFFEGTAAGSDVYIDEVKVVPPAGTSVNLMSNGSFESGIAGWSSWNGSTLSASTLQAHAGSQSLLASARPNTNQFAVSPNIGASLTPGTTYTVKAWVYQTGAGADTVRLASKVGCSSGDSFPWIHNHTSVPANTWTQLSGTLAIPAACSITEVLIFFEGTAPGSDVFIDEIEVLPPAPAANLMSNGGFEMGITGWSSWNGSALSASTAQKYAGAQSLLAAARPNNTQFAVSPNIGASLTAGTTYSVSAQVRHTGAAADTVRMVSKVGCSSGDTYSWLENDTAVAANTWTELSGSLAIPADCSITEVLIFFEGTAPGSDVYVDEVKVLAP